MFEKFTKFELLLIGLIMVFLAFNKSLLAAQLVSLSSLAFFTGSNAYRAKKKGDSGRFKFMAGISLSFALMLAVVAIGYL
ncbi:hypothetical protein [Alkalibacter saccharofermentans]|uniref:Uncharacterized protein n=1 Tax=Alkalibacter saccharofermentans DSM 14828 TaxID=1120975 RepID=A0A1M4W0H6_9FIRM|nr:hypothetical protein [Alkalibacter saccharofermentans]SHE74771.1 hypothetical protein SAMN02746064_01123 [Alkalibacter saccharofermentans DSM 14828]